MSINFISVESEHSLKISMSHRNQPILTYVCKTYIHECYSFWCFSCYLKTACLKKTFDLIATDLLRHIYDEDISHGKKVGLTSHYSAVFCSNTHSHVKKQLTMYLTCYVFHKEHNSKEQSQNPEERISSCLKI